jgi:chromosome segregation ATPase
MHKRHPRTPQWAHVIFDMLVHCHDHLKRLDMTADELSAKLDEALSKASELKDEQGSIKALVEGLKAAITDLQQQVSDLQGQIDAGQPVDLQPLADKVDALQAALNDSDAVADQVLAGTPASS